MLAFKVHLYSVWGIRFDILAILFVVKMGLVLWPLPSTQNTSYGRSSPFAGVGSLQRNSISWWDKASPCNTVMFGAIKIMSCHGKKFREEMNNCNKWSLSHRMAKFERDLSQWSQSSHPSRSFGFYTKWRAEDNAVRLFHFGRLSWNWCLDETNLPTLE